MQRIEIDVITGEQRVIEMTAEEISSINTSKDDQQGPRAAEIKARLAQIDLDSVRPLRAVVSGAATEYDHSKLALMDAEAALLRAELAAL